MKVPTFADVQSAADRVAGVAHRTPVMTSSRLDQQVGANLFFKCENLQRVGAFKFRGGYNALSRFDVEQRRAGVVTFSSGNHAQAIALSAQLLDIPATIVMPTDAPVAKMAATRGYGATVVTYDRYTEDREAIGRALADDHGMTLIPPYDHPHIMAGQGTAALELFQDIEHLDAVFVPLGGGGLLSGTALVTRSLAPDCTVIGVEPQAGNDGQQSLAAGEIVTIAPPVTIADGAQTPSLGHLTFAVIRELVDEITTASDDELVACMGQLASTMKLVVEPTGCLGLAAVMRRGASLQGQRVGIILSGGNIDLARFAELVG